MNIFLKQIIETTQHVSYNNKSSGLFFSINYYHVGFLHNSGVKNVAQTVHCAGQALSNWIIELLIYDSIEKKYYFSRTLQNSVRVWSV